MQHKVIVGAALAILAASAGLQAQDGSWVETKFHRIHLLNGNFIDGHLIGESDRALTMKIGSGEMQIRKDMIERNSKGSLRVEYVKMRSYKEAPKLETIRERKAPITRETPPPSEPKTPPSGPKEAVTLTGSVEDQLAQAADILKNGTLARKKGAIEALAPLGAEAAVLIASNLASFEDELLPVATQVLVNLKEPKILPTIRSLTASERARVREQAVTLLGVLGGDADSIRGLLRDLDNGVRGAAIVALQRLSDTDSFDLVADSLTDPDPVIRIQALSALSHFSQHANLSEKLSETLSRALNQAQGDVRLDMLKAAAGLGSKELGPLMSRLAADNDPTTRAYAISALGKINSQEYAELILERMSIEREFAPRIQLAGAAQAMRMNQSIDPLIEWLGDSDKEIRGAAMRSLRALTGQNPGSEKAAWEEWRTKSKQ